METEVMITSRWRQRELVLAAVFFSGDLPTLDTGRCTSELRSVDISV